MHSTVEDITSLLGSSGNAIKFTQTGEVVLRVTGAPAEGVERVVRFEITDTGVGIAPDKLAMIFEPFTQADTSTTREYGGTGLGLAISSQRITLMGGEVDISSELGIGSTFSFTIRVQTLDGELAAGEEPLNADLDGIRALVVDDNVTQRSILSDYLGRWGMSVETAVSTTAALEVLREAAAQDRPIAVALVDTSMRRLQGVTLGAAIVDDPLLNTRLVLMTEERDRDDLAELGDGVCLSKPIHRDELRTCLREALDLSRPEEEEVALGSVVAIAPRRFRAAAPGRGQRHQPDGRRRHSLEGRLPGGHRSKRCPGGAGSGQSPVRRHLDGLPDAPDERLPGDGSHSGPGGRAGDHVPIIALTAGAREEDRDHCLDVGMDEYLSKPIRKEPLLTMVRQWVEPGSGPGRQASRLGLTAQPW